MPSQQQRTAWLGAIVLPIVASLLSGCGDRAINALEEGKECVEEGNADGGITHFSEAIELDPLNGEAYFNRALAYRSKAHMDEALADLDEAIRLDQEYVDAYLTRAAIYGIRGDYEKAIADYNEAVRIRPQSAGGYQARGDCYLKRIQEHYKVMSGQLYTRSGGPGYDKSDLDRAHADFTQAIRLDPNHAPAYRARAELYELRARLHGDQADFKKAEADTVKATLLEHK